MGNKENYYNKEPYKAHVHAIFLAYHQVLTYCWWLLFRPTDLERYGKFEVSLERVMFIAHSLTSSILMERNLALVCASGKREQGSGPPLTVGLMGELAENKELGCKVATKAEGFKGPALHLSSKRRDAE